MEEKGGKDFIVFQSRRKIINLCKNFLILAEDLKDKNEAISDNDYQKLRKRVLDYGNDTIREIEESLDSFSIKLK
jgi:hypothetical protein